MADDLLVTRRHALLSGACACLCSVRAFAQRDESGARVFATEEVASGIHVRRGVDEDATARNEDGIANIGFIVGHDAVAVIDPGGSLIDGQRLRAAIRQVTQLPIRYVVMSHVHPDHIFGAPAFQQDHPQFVGHARLPRALALRGEYYRKRLEETLGKDRAGSVVTPTLLVQDHTEIDLGGRVLALKAHGIAHTDCDLSVLDRNTGTLLPADLLFVRRAPSLDGSLKGWLQELAMLKAVPARLAVPGHGPTSVNWPSGARDLERYLSTVLRETKEAVTKGTDLDAAVKTVAQGERSRWALFDDYNGHNVTQAFKELEWDQ
ncbi:MAG: beta-lactamase domain protein [Gammaproteobacteria bacterium]|nr:beta-lactamase domain protein [Gammaproteobacteria bacterium]